METVRVQNGVTERIEILLLDSSDVEVTGAAVTLKIRRKSDGKFWTGTVFQTAVTTVSMTEVDATDAPGEYFYNFVTLGLDDDDYYLIADADSGANIPQKGELKVGGYVDFIDKAISAISTTSGSSGGGFIAGANTFFWTESEKIEVIENVRELMKTLNTVESNQTLELIEMEKLNKLSSRISITVDASKKLIEDALKIMDEVVLILKQNKIIDDKQFKSIKEQRDDIFKRLDAMIKIKDTMSLIQDDINHLKDNKDDNGINDKLDENLDVVMDLFNMVKQTVPTKVLEESLTGGNNDETAEV